MDKLSRYRIELESISEGIRRVHQVEAGSMEEALVKVRAGDRWPSDDPGSDPGRFRVVQASVQDASSESREQRTARRRYLDTIVAAGLAALDLAAPERSDDEHYDVLCDFFTRAVALPGHFEFPAGDQESEQLLTSDDVSAVLVQLLTRHLSHHGLAVTSAHSN